MRLLGIHGKAGAGKDTLAKALRLQYGWRRMAFADPLREAACAAFGVDMEWFTDPELKGRLLPDWKLTPRHILQQMGTEAMRNTFGHDIWVRRWEQEYLKVAGCVDVVITDVREELEAARIRALGGLIVHLHRPGAGLAGEAGAHSSEAGIELLPQDYLLANDGSIGDLWGSKLKGLLRALEVPRNV